MNKTSCSEEAAVIRAARSGHWPHENNALQAHAAQCVHCKELVRTVGAMQSLAAPLAGQHLPDAELLWRQALLEQKQAEMRKAQQPLRLAAFASYGMITLVLAGWLIWSIPSPEAQLSAARSAAGPALWQGAVLVLDAIAEVSQWLVSPSSLWTSAGPSALAVLLAVVAALAAYPLLVED